MNRREEMQEKVGKAAEQLQREGTRVSVRNVRAITGGSMGDVAQCLRHWRDTETQAVKNEVEISTSLHMVLKAEIVRSIDVATKDLQRDLNEARSREEELIAALAEAEQNKDALKEALAKANQDLEATSTAAEKAAAIAAQKIGDQAKRITDLEQERDQLIKAAETSRTETTKALMQLDRADQAVVKAETRQNDLEQKIESLTKEKYAAEQQAAVAEQRGKDLEERVEDLKRLLEERPKKSTSPATRKKEETVKPKESE